MKNPQPCRFQFAPLRRDRQHSHVPQQHTRFAHALGFRPKGRGNGLLKQTLLQPDAQVTGEDAHHIRCFQRLAGGKEFAEQCLSAHRTTGPGQSVEQSLHRRKAESHGTRPTRHDFPRGQSCVIAPPRNGTHLVLAPSGGCAQGLA